MNRSLARLGGLVVASSLMLAACGAASSTTAPTTAPTTATAATSAPAAPTPAPSEAAKPVSLEFWYFTACNAAW